MIREQFITATQFKNNTSVEQNADDKQINIAIFKAQEINILPILGSNFYNHLMSQIEAETLTSDEEELINGYISFCIYEWAAYHYAHSTYSKLTNKGVTSDIAPYVATAERQQFTTKVNKLQNDAEFYCKRLINYLSLNRALFPEYQFCDPEQNLNPSKKAGTNGFYIPKRNKKKKRF